MIGFSTETDSSLGKKEMLMTIADKFKKSCMIGNGAVLCTVWIAISLFMSGSRLVCEVIYIL